MTAPVFTLKSTDVYTFDLGFQQGGVQVPAPVPDTINITDSGTGAAALSGALGVDATGKTALIVKAVTLPSPATAGPIRVMVSDTAGSTVAEVDFLYPVPLVDDITIASPVITTQPAPTAPGP